MWHFRCKHCKNKDVEKCHTCEVRRFLQDCQAAMDLVSWYLGDYHRADLGHREMIARLQWLMATIQETGQIDDPHRDALREIERRVDSWLYQTI